jgi:phenylpyruvate tautomerase PptA (4-oxalocrotonate tautomerase family)
MPFVEATMIAGYGPDVKQRLVSAFTRGVLSVMAANPDGVIVVLREVEPSNWARGGTSRVPGPPLPYALDVVREFVAGRAEVAEESVTLAEPAADYARLDESYAEQGSLVFAEGTAGGADVLDQFHVIAGRVVAHRRWMGGGHPAE